MKLLISGLCGHMGTEVAKLALAGCRGADPAATVGVDMNACGAEGMPCAVSFESATDPVFTTTDCIVDFSHHSAVAEVLAYAKATGAAAVIGTTGHTEEEKQQAEEKGFEFRVGVVTVFRRKVRERLTGKGIALVVGEVELETVDLVEPAEVDRVKEILDRMPSSRKVDHQSAP